MTKPTEPGHELIAGATRSGKSRLTAYKIARSFMENRPLCYIDPKGETYDDLLTLFSTTEKGGQIWEENRHRIILVNPVSACNTILGFNALQPLTPFANATPDYTALIANSIVSHIRKQSGFEMADANRMQNIMSAAIGLLVEGGKGKLTLAELPLLFIQTSSKVNGKSVQDDFNPLTARLLHEVRHYGTLSFWHHQWKNWTGQARREWVQSTEGRIFQYLFDERLLYSTCAVETAVLDFHELVDEGYWIFVKLPYQLGSDTVSMLLGNLLVSKLFYACMQPRDVQVPYRIILDEARFFNSGPLDVIMDTAAGYNLWLTLIVQNLEQMSRLSDGRFDHRLQESILTNSRYFAVFNNFPDAEVFAKMMFPITGQVATGVRSSGDFEYLPVQAEENLYQRRFMELRPRQVILFDRTTGDGGTTWYTPDVDIPKVERATLDRFEAAHMQVQGRPAQAVQVEIMKRQEALYAEIDPEGMSTDRDLIVRRIAPALFEGL